MSAQPAALVTRKELCALLRLHPASIRRLEKAGKLKAYHLSSKCARYHAADVDRLLTEASQRVTTKPGPKPKTYTVASA
jgi:predicted site-specific integrase-resolvase